MDEIPDVCLAMTPGTCPSAVAMELGSGFRPVHIIVTCEEHEMPGDARLRNVMLPGFDEAVSLVVNGRSRRHQDAVVRRTAQSMLRPFRQSTGSGGAQ